MNGARVSKETARGVPEEAPVPEAPRSANKPKPKKSGFRRFMSTWVGRSAAVGVATGATLLGLYFGLPDSGPPPQPGAPIEVVQGDEVSKIAGAMSTVTNALGPLGLDKDEALRALRAINFSVTIDQGHRRELDDRVRVILPPETRMSARVDDQGISVGANPGLHREVDWGFDSHVHGVYYRFSDAAFIADASGVGPDSNHSEGVANALGARIRASLPEAMREPGYEPWKDPNLEASLQRIVDLMRPAGSGDSGRSTISKPRLELWFHIDKDTSIPIPGTKYSVHFKKGMPLNIDLSFEGPIKSPVLSTIRFSFGRESLEISEKGDGRAARRMELHSAVVRPGMDVTLDYDLGAEEMLDGVRALFLVTAAIADPRIASSTTHFESTRLEGARKDIQERVDGELEPALVQLAREHDHAIPGVSLMKVLGVQPEQLASTP